jgi:predicted RNA binding protein YcfA (HicA-like mRNA interferase family)
MAKLPHISGQECVRALQKTGFEVRRQTGSHVILRKDDVIIPVPNHRHLKAGTLRSILRRADLSIEDFVELLRS